MKLLLLLLGALSLTAYADEPVRLGELAHSPAWLRLLHYRRHWFTGATSSADGPGFFLSPEGAHDPEAELRASLEALEQGGGNFGKLQQPIGCAFPLRKEFLEAKLGRKFPEDPCPDFEEFRRKLSAKSVSLVFATAYPNNPASMFGHSFLKFQRGAEADLLDWSVNFAAIVPTEENSFAFAALGLAGGYKGQFSLIPYYAKIEEYGYGEGRDLWEYELALTPREIDALLKAVWELETNSFFYYYFFDENCSYQVLTMLEIARPDWNLSEYFLYMAPGESVARVARTPGAVKGVRMRPSLPRRLGVVAAAMTREEQPQLERARAAGPAGLEGRALEAYLLYLQAEKQKAGEKWPPEEEARLHEALTLRAREPAPPPVITEFGGENSRPDFSHGSYRLGVGPEFTKREHTRGGAEISLRLAYHSLLDPDPGFLPHSEVVLPRLRFRYLEKFRLEEAELLSLVSLTPRDLLRWPWAWRARIAYHSLLDLPCDSCRGVTGEGGIGKALSLKLERWTIWGMLGAEGDWAEALDSTARFTPWFELGSLYTLPTNGKILLESRLVRSFARAGLWRWDFHGGFTHPFNQNWAMELEGRGSLPEASRLRTEASLLALHYF